MMSACSSTEIQGIAVATSARYKFCPVSSSFKGSLFSLHFLCAQKQTKGHLVFKPGPINLLIEAVDCAKGERNIKKCMATNGK